MEFRQLKCFEAVAAELSFTRAAAGLFLSQSTVSQQISALEAELGVQLLARDTHSVRLTQAGASFYRSVKQILPMLDEAVENARVTDRTKHYAEKLTLGFPPSINRALLGVARPILETKTEYPYLLVDIKELAGDRMIQALFDGVVEAVITLEHPEDAAAQPQQLESVLIARRKIYIGLSRYRMELDGLSASTPVSELLSRYPLNILASNVGMIQQAYAIYRQFGIPPNVCYSGSQMKMLFSARIGNGLVLAPDFQIQEDENQKYLQYFDIGIENLCLLQKAYWMRMDKSEPLRFFLERLKAQGGVTGAESEDPE